MTGQNRKRKAASGGFVIQPLGSQLLDGSRTSCRISGQGMFFVGMSDQFLLDFIIGLDVNSICKLAQCSKFLYVCCYNDSVWKEKSLSDFRISLFDISWRNSFKMNQNPTKFVRDNILVIDNFYSDYMFASINCAKTILPETRTDSIPRTHAPAVKDFHLNYSQKGVPCIITGAMTGWSCLGKWTLDFLAERYGNVKFRAEAIDISMKTYLSYVRMLESDDNTGAALITAGDESPCYIFDKDFIKNCPDMEGEFRIPEYFSSDLFSVLGDQRPDYRWLIAGPARSGSTIHIDPNSTSAWNAVISGRKRWILYPPNWKPPGIYTNKEQSEITSPVSLAEWYLNFYNDVKADMMHAQKRGILGPMEGICCAGEIMFVPCGWWHCVVNLDESIALTQNYVDEWNLFKVLTFLSRKRDQVSGYRGEGELYESFIDALQSKRPDIVLPVIEKDKRVSLWRGLVRDKPKSFSFLT